MTAAAPVLIEQHLARGEPVVRMMRELGVSYAEVKAARDRLKAAVADDVAVVRPASSKLKPCGTQAAYLRHRRSGERPCPDCCAANSAAVSLRRARCGTPAGYDRHVHRGERACEPCRAAAADHEFLTVYAGRVAR